MTAAFYRDAIIACGGSAINHLTGEGIRTDKCFKLTGDLIEWVEIDPLPYGSKDELRSSLIDDKLFLAGGNDGDIDLDETFILEGDSFTDGAPLPIEMAAQCQLTINGTHIFFSNFNGAFLLDWYEQRYIQLLEEDEGIYNNGICAILNNPDIGKEVFIAGDDVSHILNLSSMEWRDGPPLPIDFGYAAVAQLDDGFMTFGGDSRQGGYDTIFKFSQNSYEWEEMGRLSTIRINAAAVPVPNDFLNCK